jgi:hypothetical protein
VQSRLRTSAGAHVENHPTSADAGRCPGAGVGCPGAGGPANLNQEGVVRAEQACALHTTVCRKHDGRRRHRVGVGLARDYLRAPHPFSGGAHGNGFGALNGTCRGPEP